jgi:hypothetical protein
MISKATARVIRFNCINGRYRRATEANAYLGGVVPFGYDVEVLELAGRRRSQLVVDERPMLSAEGELVELDGAIISEAGVVRWLYEQKARHRWTHIRICRALNDAGIPTASQHARGRHRKHTWPKGTMAEEQAELLPLRQWLPDTVGKILRNPIYRGEMNYGSGRASGGTNRSKRQPVKQRYLAIVAEALWHQAQDVMAENEKNSGRNNKRHQYLLRGKVFCSCCTTIQGTPRRWAGWTQVNPKRGYEIGYYLCPTSQRRRSGYTENPARCPLGMIRQAELEADLWAKLLSHIQDSEGTLAKLRTQAAAHAEREAALLEERDSLRARQVKREAVHKRTVTLITEGILTKAEGKERLEEVRAEIDALTAQIHALDQQLQASEVDEGQLHQAGEHLADWQAKLRGPFTWEQRRAAVEQFVKAIRVTVGKDGGTELVYQFAFDPEPVLDTVGSPMLGRSRTGSGSYRLS